jgi:DNA-directed RNA polymerase specialized sigma24 family protein
LQAAEATKLTEGQPEPAGVLQLEHPGLASAIAAFDEDPAARRLRLLTADRALVDQLMLQGYAGPEWVRFARALAEYGYPIMRGWVFTDAIFLRCAEKGIGQLPRTNRRFDAADAAEIAGETVAEAIRRFRDRVLIPGKWDMTRGASLNTFFVGQCILRFPNVYRRWYREAQDQLLVLSDLAALKVDLSMLRTESVPPEIGAELSRAVGALQPRDPRVIVGLTELGYDQKDMAELLNTTVRGIQSRLFRHRRPKES